MAAALSKRDTMRFSAACQTLLDAVPADFVPPFFGEGAQLKHVAATAAATRKREAAFHHVLYGALRFMGGGVPGVEVTGEFPDQSGRARATIAIKFPEPAATWVIEFGASRCNGTAVETVLCGEQLVTAYAGNVGAPYW